MASKGEVGVEIDVARVPLREAGMEPFEIMVSESQERMLCVVEPARVDEVHAFCEKWEVYGTAIGTVTDTYRVVVRAGDRVVGDMPEVALVDECPIYDLEPARPQGRPGALYPAAAASLDAGGDPADTLLALLGSPNVASRLPLFQQYDWLVQS